MDTYSRNKVATIGFWITLCILGHGGHVGSAKTICRFTKETHRILLNRSSWEKESKVKHVKIPKRMWDIWVCAKKGIQGVINMDKQFATAL